MWLEQRQQEELGEKISGGKPQWAGDNQEGLKEQGEKSGLFFPERNREHLTGFKQAGNKARPAMLKGHSAIWCAGCLGGGRRHQGRKQQRPQGRACP